MPFSDKLITSKKDSFCETLYIPNHKPDLERLLDIAILPEVLDYVPITTPKGLSFEGQSLTGLSILATVSFKIKISYMSTHNEQSIHSVHYNHLKSISFNIPEKTYTQDTHFIIENGQMTLSPLINSIYTKPMDHRSMYAYIMLVIHAFIC